MRELRPGRKLARSRGIFRKGSTPRAGSKAGTCPRQFSETTVASTSGTGVAVIELSHPPPASAVVCGGKGCAARLPRAFRRRW